MALRSDGKGYVLPQGSQPKKYLSGEELTFEVLSYDPDGDMCRVRYPDGYVRPHQVKTVPDLLDKVSGQLRTRYNVQSFEIKAIPESLNGKIVITGVKYA